MKQFIPTFYPTYISEKTLKKIIAEIFFLHSYHEEHDKVERYYDGFDFYLYNRIADVMEWMDDDPPYMTVTKKIDIAVSMSTEIALENFARECIDNWKRINIRDYHTFLQICMEHYEDEYIRRKKICKASFNVWRSIDFEQFYTNLSYLSNECFLNEINRIETDYIEQMI